MDANMDIAELQKLVEGIGQPAPVHSPNVADPEPEAPAKPQPAAPGALKTFVNAEKLQQDVAFNLNNLDEGIREQAGKFVWYASLAAAARRQYEQAKLNAEVTESQLYAAHREQMANDGKKVTEAQVDAAVKMDPRYIASQTRVIDARAIFDIANDSREAFAQRKDMLVQVSVDRRKEREGELRVMAAQNDAGAQQNTQQSQLKAFMNAQQNAQ